MIRKHASPRLLPVLFLAALLVPLTASSLAADSCASSNGSNFNGTSIPGGDFVWFNAVAKVKGIDRSSTTTIQFGNSTVAFTAGSTAYQLNVPGSTIVFSPSASEATTTFDGTSWTTTVPSSYSGNVFVAGLAFQVPAGGLGGGINPVTWSGQFTSATSGLNVQWQWGAAVYTQFSADHGALGVKPIDGDKASPYANSDHAGTPENFKPFVTGGARGGGGSNWTGSYSGTVAVVPCNVPALAVQKVFAESPLFNGVSSSFTISVTNQQGETAIINLADNLDPALQLDSVTVTEGNGTCSATGQTVSCQFSSVASGGTVQAVVGFTTMEQGACPQAGCPVVNCATATDDTGDSATGCATVEILTFHE